MCNNRQILTDRFVQNQLDKMSLEDLESFFFDRFYSECENLTEEELKREIGEYAPELMEE